MTKRTTLLLASLVAALTSVGCHVDVDSDSYVAEVDCNDADASINPGAIELCDDLDNNCNGVVDEGVIFVWYRDEDDDGYIDVPSRIRACVRPVSGRFVSLGREIFWRPGESLEDVERRLDDCDDGDASVQVVTTWYLDADADGYGFGNGVSGCHPPTSTGYSHSNRDCDDRNPKTNPRGDDLPGNGVDEDCRGGDSKWDPGGPKWVMGG